MERDDVGVLDVLQDVHLTLDVFPRHPPATRLAASLLDGFGSVLHTRIPVSTSSDHSKLSTGGEKKGLSKSVIKP